MHRLGLDRIARLGPVFWLHGLRIRIRNLNLAHDLGHPCVICVAKAGMMVGEIGLDHAATEVPAENLVQRCT